MKFKLSQFFLPLLFLAALPVGAAYVQYPVEVTVFSCNSNGICETVNGENDVTCSDDCGCNNNGICETDRLENIGNCAADCLTSTCGNGVCDSGIGENFGNCAIDCHCGNGVCDWSENNALCAADCPATGGGGGGASLNLFIANLKITQKNKSATVIDWTTNLDASCQLTWGRDLYYTSGLSTEAFITQLHNVMLTDLAFNVPYYFKIFCKDPLGREAYLQNVSFLLKEEISPLPVLEVPLVNVDNLTVGVKNHQAELSWTNAVNKNYREIIIRRSFDFYPSFTSGELVYRGTGEFQNGKWVAWDRAFNNRTTYYSVFTTDGLRISSGVLTAVVMFQSIPIYIVQPEVDIVPPNLSAEVLEKIYQLNLYDLDFINSGQKLPFLRDLVTLNSSRSPLTVAITASKVPPEIKNLVLVITGPNSFQQYLMSKDCNDTRFSATLAGLLPGEYEVDIILYDQHDLPIRNIQGRLKSNSEELLQSYLKGLQQVPQQVCWGRPLECYTNLYSNFNVWLLKYWWWLIIILVLSLILLGKFELKNRKKIK